MRYQGSIPWGGAKGENMWLLRYHMMIWCEKGIDYIIWRLPNRVLFRALVRTAAMASKDNPTKEFGTITVQDMTKALKV